jgi:hypothetical protein
MPGAPRSQVLIASMVSTGNFTPFWECPPGYVTLVKSLTITNNLASPNLCAVSLTNADQLLQIVLWQDEIPPATAVHIDLWTALNTGDFMYGWTQGNNASFWIAGAVLSGPNQFPVASLTKNQLPGFQPLPFMIDA